MPDSNCFQLHFQNQVNLCTKILEIDVKLNLEALFNNRHNVSADTEIELSGQIWYQVLLI